MPGASDGAGRSAGGDALPARVVLNQFTEAKAPRRPSLLYNINLLIVAGAMLILPLIYVGMILGVAYLLFQHATDLSIFEGSGRIKGKVAVYLLPLIIGGATVLFMLKPLFAPRGEREVGPTVTAEEQPVLFALIERICTAVGSPMPKRVEVNCAVNASASYRNGIWSALTPGGDLVLTIGLPLVSGMSAQQLAGVLAHEFGHFSQGMGMRLSFVIRSVSHWFARCVYQRDQWDEYLIAFSRHEHLGVLIIANIIRLIVWLTRRILWVLMYAGHLISSIMLRQMEYDADRYEAFVAGSDGYSQIMRQIVLLDMADSNVKDSLSTIFGQGRLCDDLPRFIAARAWQAPDEVKEKLEEIMTEAKTGLFDSHPSFKDRIARAEKLSFEGLFHLKEPASRLFNRYDVLSKATTFAFYRSVLEDELDGVQMVDTDTIVGEEQRLTANLEEAQRFFGEVASANWPLLTTHEHLPKMNDPKAAAKKLGEARKLMQGQLVEAQRAYKELDVLYDKLIRTAEVRLILQAGLQFGAGTKVPHDIPTDSLPRVNKYDARQRQLVESWVKKLRPYEQAARVRLFAGLSLIQMPKVSKAIENADEMLSRVEDVYNTWYALSLEAKDIQAITIRATALATLIDVGLSMDEVPASLRGEARTMGSNMQAKIEDMRITLDDMRYPFEHAQDNISVGEYAFGGREVNGQNPFDVFHSAANGINILHGLQLRVLAELVEAVDAVEKALRLPPLTPPPKEEQAEQEPSAAPVEIPA